MARVVPDHWSVSEDKNWLEREFKFESYRAGLDKAMQVGGLADEINHHPDMELGYKRLKVRYTSHDEDGLGDRDFEAAQRVNELDA